MTKTAILIPARYGSTRYLELRIERVEKLEQLRWLKNGWQIGCYRVNFNVIEINTPDDVEEWNAKQAY